MKRTILISFIVIFLFSGLLFAQNAQIRPVSPGDPMPDFTLPAYQGGEVTLSNLKGKMVLLIFPRGKYSPEEWCHICHYKYAELCELKKEKQNLEILYVLPYDKEMISDWFDKMPKNLQDIERWKNPANENNLNARRKAFLERVRKAFPKKIEYAKGEIPTSIPILIDADEKVSKGLGLFKPDWDGGKGPQNVPTVYIIDKNGKVQFKYHSQNTWDRPNLEHIMNVLPCADYWGKGN